MQPQKTHKVYLKTTNNPAKQRSSYGMFFTLQESTTFCQSLIIIYVVLHTDRYIHVSRSLLDLDNWPATPSDVAGGRRQ